MSKPKVITKSFIQKHHSLTKYWNQRYRLFHKFDQGIQFDKESLYSTTPECIAKHHAERIYSKKSKHSIIIDAFCGVGGNTIQFAKKFQKVIAIDIDPKKIQLAKANCAIYDIDPNTIEFIVGDYFQVLPTLFAQNKISKHDSIFLSPPWGGPKYKDLHKKDTPLPSPMSSINYRLYFEKDLSKTPLHTCQEMMMTSQLYNIETDCKLDGLKIYDTAAAISSNICYYLPRNLNLDTFLAMFSSRPLFCFELENNYLNHRLFSKTLYFGDLKK